jgi:hypothetical protein
MNEVEKYCKEHGITKTTPAQYRAILAYLAQVAARKQMRDLEK